MCSICGVYFTWNSNLRTHVNSVHEKKRNPCRICGCSLVYANGLRLHIKIVHKDLFTPMVTVHSKVIRDNTYAQVVADFIPTTPPAQSIQTTSLSPDGAEFKDQEQASVANPVPHTQLGQVSGADVLNQSHIQSPTTPGA